MTAQTLIFEQAQGEAPSMATALDDVRDIDPTLRNWAAFWIGMGWQISRIDGGYSAVTPAHGGGYFIRQAWAEIDPAVCAEHLAIALDRWPWLLTDTDAPAWHDTRDVTARRAGR